MVKIVKCIVCEKNIKTYGKDYFNHCGHRQTITDDNWINKPNNSLSSEGDTTKTAQEGYEGESLKQTSMPIVDDKQKLLEGQSSPLDDLEIEDDEPENPLENLPEEKKEFHCPNCNNQLNEYETPCPKCFYEIEWQ